MQKGLPRIQGSSLAVLTALLEMLKKLSNADIKNEMDFDIVEQTIATQWDGVSNRRCVNKLLFMLRRFHEDGFTSFWL